MIRSPSRRRPSVRLIVLANAHWILAVITGVVLLANVPSVDAISTYFAEAILYGVLTAFALFFGVVLSQGELSPAHMIGVTAFLSLPAGATSVMTWGIFIGAVGGMLLRAFSQSATGRRRVYHLVNSVFVITRVTLSFWAAGEVYLSAGGRVPMSSLPGDISRLTVALLIYALVYMTLYFSIFLLEIYAEGYAVRQTVRADLSRVMVVLLLPIPFAILGAEVISQLTAASRIVLILGLVLIVLALYALSLSEYRLRKQLDEQRTLSIVAQAMRSHLSLETLVRTIYVHIAGLMNVDGFTVALLNPDSHHLEFPFMIKYGQEITGASASPEEYSKNLTGYVLKTEQPLLIEDEVLKKTRELGLEAVEPEIQSWLGVPLMAGSQTPGVMVIISYDPRRKFNRNDLRLLNTIAASSSIAIENAQLYRLQTERAEQLVILNRIASLLGGTLSPDKVLDTIISSASTISSANAVAVYLFWDDARSTLPLVRSAGLSDQFILSAPDAISFQKRDLTGNTLLPTAVADIRVDQRAEGLRADLLKENKLALLELPLEIGDQNLGVLVFYYDQPQVFTDDKVELLKTFVNQAAQAVNNARLYATTDEAFQRSVEQLLSLASIGRVLTSTIDLKNICELVLTQVTEATKVDTGMVVLKDELTDRLLLISHQGYTQDPTGAVAAYLNIHKQVMETGQIYRIDDVREDALYSAPGNSTLSLISVPILRGRDVLGVITLESKRLNAFTEEDSYFVTQVANQAVIAIDNARLFSSITEAHDRLRVLLDAMEEGIILVDTLGQVALANPRIDLIGLRQSQLIDRNLRDLVDIAELKVIEAAGFASRQDVLDFIDHLKNPRTYAPVNYVVQGEHGVLHIRRQIVPVRDVSGQIIGVLLVFYNKTEEEELVRSREELSRMIVHDLRSPLTAVTTSLRLLQELVPKDIPYYTQVTSTTDTSRRAIRKLLSRVDSLLDVARMESGQISIEAELTEIKPLIDNVRAELAPLAQELNVEIEAQIDPALPPLDVDSDKVERLLLNLVDNALKYTAQDSSIVVRNHPVGEDGAKEGYVRIDVADRGPGVPADYKNTLFERFVQIEGRRKVRRGVGLGLTFCRLVTEAHGGRIWIEDNPGGGTIFAFTLPVANMHALDD